MWRLMVALMFTALSGCASFNLHEPERWVENNTLYSTKFPGIEVKVVPDLLFDTAKMENELDPPTDKEFYLFSDSSNETRFIISFKTMKNLTKKRSYYWKLPDYSKHPDVLLSNEEKLGGIRFTTGVRRGVIDGLPALEKRYGANAGELTQYSISYRMKAPRELIRKPAHLLSEDDWKFIYSFSKQADESFSIADYSGVLPPKK